MDVALNRLLQHAVEQVWPAVTVYVLLAARVGGFVTAAPLLGRSVVPPMLRVAVVLVLPLCLLPVAGEGAGGGAGDSAFYSSVPLGLDGWLRYLASEATVGLLLGLGVTFLFAGVLAAGRLIDHQLGWATRDVLFPEIDGRGVGEWTAVAVVLGLLTSAEAAGLVEVFKPLGDAFFRVPIGGGASFALSAELPAWLGQLLQASCVLALRIAGPLLAVLFFVHLAAGVVFRGWPASAGSMPFMELRVLVALVFLSGWLPVWASF